MAINVKKVVENLIKKYKTCDPYEICKEMNIHVRFKEYSSLKGFYKKMLRQKFIVINESLNEKDREVVLFHELGHAVMHSNEDMGLMKKHFKYQNYILEKEANEFAVEFLMIKYKLLDNVREIILEKIKEM